MSETSIDRYTSTTSSSRTNSSNNKQKKPSSQKGVTTSRFPYSKFAAHLCIAFVIVRQLTFQYQPATQLVEYGVSEPSALLSSAITDNTTNTSSISISTSTSDNNVSSNAVVSNSTINTANNSSNSTNQPWKSTPDTPYEVCFVTSVYGDDATISDQPPDVTQLQKNNPTSRFFAFTNMPDLKAEGWNLITNNSTRYRRYITRSRWPKFMGWMHPEVIKCQAVFYMDGFCGPRPENGNMARLKLIAHTIAKSKYGIAQNKHPWGGGAIDELNRILKWKKDIVENTEASKAWFQAQPDFNPKATLYVNQFIGYDPKNQYWQNATQFFWNRYSQELDSWRDQPLWSYTLDKLKIKPIELGPDKLLFRMYKGRLAKDKHTYDAKTDRKGQ